jgi:Ca2+-binding RTX toxin-like protein
MATINLAEGNDTVTINQTWLDMQLGVGSHADTVINGLGGNDNLTVDYSGLSLNFGEGEDGIHIQGNSNIVQATGETSYLEIAGNGNRVTANLRDIYLAGNNNIVRSTKLVSPGYDTLYVSDRGANNNIEFVDSIRIQWSIGGQFKQISADDGQYVAIELYAESYNSSYDLQSVASALFGGSNNTIEIGALSGFLNVNNDNNTLSVTTASQGSEIDFWGNRNRYSGGSGTDNVNLIGSNTVLESADGDDVITLGIERGNIDTGNGDDTIYESATSSVINAGSDNDTVSLAGDRNEIIAGGGDDAVALTGDYLFVSGDGGNDTLTTSGDFAKLEGGDGNDVLSATGEGNRLDGGAGDDRLILSGEWNRASGGDGSDIISSGWGRDTMTGGASTDVFDFNRCSDSDVQARDVIKDFEAGVDHIDLRGIDASTLRTGNNAFTFIGAERFHKVAGELHFKFYDREGTDHDVTVVSADVTGDGRTDFAITLTGLKMLTAADFVL